MTVVVLFAWITFVAVIDVLITRPWSQPAARKPLPWIFAAVGAAWVLWWGANAYRDSMADGQWTAASITMGYVPLKALFYSLLSYFAGRTLLSVRKTASAWLLPAALSAILVFLVASDIVNAHSVARMRHARNEHLSPDQAAAITERIRKGEADENEQTAFLRNPICPPDLLAEFAATPDVVIRAAVAANPKLGVTLAEQLAGDASEDVRYYLAFNRDLPSGLVSRLAHDASERVREAVLWTPTLTDDDFDLLVNDPSPRVRATAAMQQRISGAQVDRLKADPEERVRSAANRWQSR